MQIKKVPVGAEGVKRLHRFDFQPRTMSHAECTPCENTSWINMVAPEAYGVEPACIACGCMLKGKKKRMQVARLVHGVKNVVKAHGEHHIPRTVLNVMKARAQVQKDCFCCLCCHHWIENRFNKNVTIVPLLSFHLQVRFLTHGKKKVDTRIMHRIACSLNETGNFYRTMFSCAELHLCARIASQPMMQLKHELVVHFDRQNAFPLFVHNAKTAELLREKKNHKF